MCLNHLRVLMVSAVWFFCSPPTAKAVTRPWSLGFDQEPVDTRFAQSHSAVLNCSPRGHPTPSVTWRNARDKILITTNITLRYILPNGSLYFPPFSKEEFDPYIHRADYECLAENKAGKIVSRKAKLHAVLKEHYTVYAADARVAQGSTALIRCVVPDAVLPYVHVESWRQSEGILTLGGRFSVMPSGDLVITNVNSDDTQKMFFCTTVNTLTGEKLSSNPAKVYLEKVQNVAPKMTSRALDIAVDVGETAVLQCTAYGSYIQYKWTKDDRNVQVNGRFYMYAGGSLRIEGTKFEDKGVYLCKASNSDGDSVTMAISLSVRDPLDFKVRPVSKSLKLRDGRVALECGITGQPVPNVTWYKDAERVILNERITMTPQNNIENSRWDFNLSFSSVENGDAGTYQCFADNGVDVIQSSASFIRDGKIPSITTNLPTVLLDRNQPLRLSCQASAIATPDITWELDGVPLVSGYNGYTISDKILSTGSTAVDSTKNSTLRHQAVSVKNGGKYKCGACSVVGCSAKEIVVHVKGPPEITRITSPVNSNKSHSARLECVAKGYPVPEVTWPNNGYNLRHTYYNNTLVISKLIKSDERRYQCKAENKQGQVNKYAVLNVLEPPELSLTLNEENGLVRFNEMVRVMCDVKSPINYNVTWKKDGVVIKSSDGLEIKDLSGYPISIISIKKVNTAQAGMYTCIAANADGSAEVSKEIIVVVPPRFTEEPVDERVLKTYTARLTCKATGFPLPRIDWQRKIDENFFPVQYSARVEKMLNGTLLVRNVTEADEGLYICIAVGLKETSVSRNVRLHVHAVPATISSAPENISKRVSTSVVVRCVAFGNLPIDVSWYNGPRKMKNGSRVTMEKMPGNESYQVIGTLRMGPLVLQDTGSYSCHVKNSFGIGKKTFQITAQDKPSPPSKPGVEHLGPRSLNIVWNAKFDGNSPITGFIIQYKLEENDWERKPVAGNVTKSKLTSLIPASYYRLRISAENALGTGNAGPYITVETKEDAPSGPPNIINVTAKSSTEILVKWQPPPKKDRNGIIMGYYVIFKRANKHKLTNITVMGGSKSTFVIKDLKPWKEYKVKVQAFTKAGVGPRLDKWKLVKTKEGVPSKPPPKITVQPLSSTKIEVKWEQPTVDSINGELQGYKVRYYKVSEPSKKTEKKTGKDDSRVYVLSGLAKFTTYKISVLAYTRIGDGVASAETEVRTEEDVPGPPHDVRAVPVSRAVIRVLWKLPLEPNGKIREYNVSYSRDASGKSGSKSFQLLGNCTFVELTLEDDTVYYFWVKAKTSKGYGNASKVVERKTEDKIAANIFDKELPTVFARRNGFAVLNCDAYGDPKPTIRWERVDWDLSATSKYEQLKNGSLKVLQLQKEDGGEYTCTASNNLDTKKVTRKLKVQVPPSPPTNIVIKVLSSNSAVNITWTPGFDGNSPVSEFLLEFRSNDGEWARTRVLHGQLYYVHSVQTDGVELFRMSAINEIGRGKRSRTYRMTRGPGFITVEEYNPEDEVKTPGRRTFYHDPAILGTLIGVSVLVVAVFIFLSLLAYRGGYIDLKKVREWRQRILGKSTEGRSGRGNQSDERPPTSGPTATLERLPTPDGSEISFAGSSNYPLPFYPHDTILEEDFVSLPPPYQSVTRLRGSLISRHAQPDDSNSDTSSEVSCGRQVYHRPTLHTNGASARARRYMVSGDPRASVHRSIRSLTETSRVSSLCDRGHADGRSELDTSISKSLELSNPELRYYSTVRPLRFHGHSQEFIPPVCIQSTASMARDSGLGHSEFGQSSTHSRRSSNSSQVTPLARPTPSPMRRDSASSRESSCFPVNGNKLSASRDRKAYDSTSSECSSSRDELMAALEFGKRHNLDKYYGIPTLETTSASSEATNTSSDLEGVCKFSASPRLSGHGCLAPVPVRPPPFNPRSRSRVNENYMYVLNTRRMSRNMAYGMPHNGSLV